MYNMDEIESMELMIKNMKATKTNVDFFDMMIAAVDFLDVCLCPPTLFPKR